jgi:hypothetical protein
MSQSLSFPNIQFTETVVNPPAIRRSWRDTIGVVSEFNSGPIEPTLIESRQAFTNLYGDDTSPGAVQVLQAMEMNANRFIVSRAIPENTAGLASFSISSVNPVVEPTIGYESVSNNSNLTVDSANRTTGVSLNLSYVGNPITKRITYSPITTVDTVINHATFDGRANLNVFVTDFIDGGTTAISAGTLTWTYPTLSSGEIGIATFPKAETIANDLTTLLPILKPGHRVVGSSLQDFAVLSKPFSLDEATYGVVIEAIDNLGTATGNYSIYPPVNASYVVGYSYDFVDSNTITPYTSGQVFYAPPNQVYNDGFTDYTLDGYMVVPVTKTANSNINFYYLTSDGTVVDDQELGVEYFGTATDEGIRVVFGEAAGTQVILNLHGQVTIPFAATKVSVGGSATSSTAYQAGTSGSAILRDLQRAISKNSISASLIESSELSTLIPPYTIKFKTRVLGTEGQRLKYRISRLVQGTASSATDILVQRIGETPSTTDSAYSVTNWTLTAYKEFHGAISGPNVSFRDFYALDGTPILRVEAVSPGEVSINVSLQPLQVNEDTAVFSLAIKEIRNANSVGREEILNLDNRLVDSQTGLYLGSSSSSLCRAYFLPIAQPALPGVDISDEIYALMPLRLAPPLGRLDSTLNTGLTAISAAAGALLNDVALQGGSNYKPSTVSQAEARRLSYLSALKRLENEDIAIIILPGITYGNASYQAVFDEAKRQAETSNPVNGLRVAVFDAPKDANAGQVQSYTSQIDSQRVVLCVGSQIVRRSNGRFSTDVGSSGVYAATLAVRPPHISTASIRDNVFPASSLIRVDTRNDVNYLDEMTRHRAEVLYKDTGLNVYKFLNGRTTSSDPNWRYISIRRLWDQLISDINSNLIWVKSENNTTQLQARVASAIDAILTSRLRDSWISSYEPTVCNDSNNTALDRAEGKLNILVVATPSVPADFIRVKTVLNLSQNISINVAPGG